jgi:hypothetical protein
VQRGENAKRLILFAAPRIIKKALGVDLSKAVQTKSLIKRTPQRAAFFSRQTAQGMQQRISAVFCS